METLQGGIRAAHSLPSLNGQAIPSDKLLHTHRIKERRDETRVRRGDKRERRSGLGEGTKERGDQC
jgi:hypothetical protein